MNRACPDLCGGCSVMGISTAITCFALIRWIYDLVPVFLPSGKISNLSG